MLQNDEEKALAVIDAILHRLEKYKVPPLLGLSSENYFFRTSGDS